MTRLRRALGFGRRLFHKAEADAIFFMAGAISFNVLVAFVPLVLFVVGLLAFVLSARLPDPGTALVERLMSWVPQAGGEIALTDAVQRGIERLLAQRRGFTLIGGLLLVWFSTRLVGTLRTALKTVFELRQGRSIVRGKLFDMKIVLLLGGLFGINIGVTTFIEAVQSLGAQALGLQGSVLSLLQTLTAQGLAVVSIWVLFVAVYRYLPAERRPWRVALVAATFTAAIHELLKAGFGWYVTDVANYRSTYGNLITVAVLVFWIYYEAVGFILGGEVAHLWFQQTDESAPEPTPEAIA